MTEWKNFTNALTTTLQDFVFAYPLTTIGLCFTAVCLCLIAFIFAFKKQTQSFRMQKMLMYCTEALRCQPDGFYLWLYDEVGFLTQTVCSSRLAVMMNLFDGQNAGFDSVLERFSQDATDQLIQNLQLMRTEQKPFSLTISSLDGTKHWLVNGFQAQTLRNTPLLDILWFRDITDETSELTVLSEKVLQLKEQQTVFNDIFNSFPFPVWVRNDDLQIIISNPAYQKAIQNDFDEQDSETSDEIIFEKSPKEALILAAAARASGREHKSREYLLLNGKRRLADVSEIPLKQSNPAQKGTLGFLRDVTAYREMEENLRNHIKAHNGVLEHLKTAVAVFNPDMRLTFYNTSFLNLWDLDEQWLDTSPTYALFIDMLHEKRKLPEHRDFNAYKKQELHFFSTLVSMREDTLHLPNGLTLRRTMTPHPLGGLLIIYEDVTDHLVMERSMTVLNDTQRTLIDKMQEAVLVFSNTSRVRFINSAYARLWGVDIASIEREAPTVPEMIEKQKPFFENVADWTALKEQLLGTLHTQTEETFQLSRSDGVVLEFTVASLPDGGIFVSYLDVTQSNAMTSSLQERNEVLLQQKKIDAEKNRHQQDFFKHFFDELFPLLTQLNASTPSSFSENEDLSETLFLLKNKISTSQDLYLLQSASSFLELDSLDIPSFIKSLETTFSVDFATKSLTFKTIVPKNIGFCITDKEQLRLVFSCLLKKMVELADTGSKISLKVEKNSKKQLLFTLSRPWTSEEKSFNGFEREKQILSDSLSRQNASITFSRKKKEERIVISLSCPD